MNATYWAYNEKMREYDNEWLYLFFYFGNTILSFRGIMTFSFPGYVDGLSEV